MIVVGGGSSTRFGGDKLIVEIAGRPLISHTLDSVVEHVDVCVAVCGPAAAQAVAASHPRVIITPGGSTRTLSELAGLSALGDEAGLIGIHDAARPAVRGSLVDRLFTLAAARGGAVPLVDPGRMILDRRTQQPVGGLRGAQTPQVFRGPDLMAAYARAADAGYDGHDTAEIMQRFAELEIVGVPGDPTNIKVTYPDDLSLVTDLLEGLSRT
jgi:2-C-methyl-D-erythritol 4-phosphate cytidylyltransferase